MIKRFFTIAVTLAGLLLSPLAASQSNENKAAEMVEKAIAVAQSEGSTKLVERINAKDTLFISGDIYVVVRDRTGTILAHPTKPGMVGQNLNEVPDAEGKMFRKEITEGAKTKGSGWVDYKSKNPTTSKSEEKKTFYKASGDIIVEAGTYK